MAWQELRLICMDDVAEVLGEALLERGALSVSVEDADAGSAAEQPIFGEPGSPPDQIWRHNRLVALFAADADARAALADAAGACGLTTPACEIGEVVEEDWVRKTQSQFDPLRITERLWIVPTWHVAPDPQAISIRLDPGLAFGTGSHPTTRLCLRWLDQAPLAGRSVLDYGCGSGILAIAAKKFGATPVTATDIDPQALVAARDNASANDCAINIQDTGTIAGIRADVVVANILTNPLKVLAPALVAHLAQGGRLTLSGILESQEDEVVAAYSPLIRLRRFASEDGWTCLSGTREG